MRRRYGRYSLPLLAAVLALSAAPTACSSEPARAPAPAVATVAPSREAPRLPGPTPPATATPLPTLTASATPTPAPPPTDSPSPTPTVTPPPTAIPTPIPTPATTPTISDRAVIEVVVDTCLNLREEPSLDAAVRTCLPNGATVKIAAPPWEHGRASDLPWLYIRTNDGLEGWASAEYLRRHRGGARLEEAPAPTLPPAGAGLATPPGVFAAVALGGHYDACVLTAAREAVCWDMNAAEEAVALPGPYIAIDAAGGTTCAVTAGGEPVCWGSDESAAGAPPGRYTTVSTTEGYTCGLTEAGEAVCWGSHSERAHRQRAEEGDTEWSGWPLGRMPDPPPDTYVAITVGYSGYLDGSVLSACAARAGGGRACWSSSGKYDYDEERLIWVGDGDPAVPVINGDFCSVNGWGPPSCNSYGRGYTAISEGGSHTCAITLDGAAECWSSEVDVGALDVMHPPDPSPARYAAISTDGPYGCAVTDAGDLACWESERNVTPSPDPAPGPYVSVSDGTSHTCALTEAGEAVCWGLTNHGQTHVPPGEYTAISAGEFHTCALTVTGEAVCWGAIYADAPAGRYAALSAGSPETGGTACALTYAGEPICWGDPYGIEPPAGRYVAIDVRDQRGCALTEAGEAVCWNRNGSRNLDVPSDPFAAIGVGGGRTCALTALGGVLCWDRDGTVMTGTPSGHHVALAVGWNHACALTEGGEAACWAWRYSRYKGLEEEGPYEGELTQPPPGHYIAISASEYRSCALTEAGDVVCWGDAAYTRIPRPLRIE